MNKIPAYAAQEAKGEVSPFSIERRKLGPNDVNIEIEYCGVCHTDLHFVNNDWGRSMYPIVPGHEIVGRVSAIGETQKMLDFCAEKQIVSEVEIIRMDQINQAYERLLKSDVKYRFVIDMSSLRC